MVSNTSFYFYYVLSANCFCFLDFSKSMGIERLPPSMANTPLTLGHSSAHGDSPANKSIRSGHRSGSNALNRKLEMEFISNLEKRNHDEDSLRRRIRSERPLNTKVTSSSSSDGAVSDVKDDAELVELLSQSKNRLENTDALRVRSHLLRPEDYVSGCPSANTDRRITTGDDKSTTTTGFGQTDESKRSTGNRCDVFVVFAIFTVAFGIYLSVCNDTA